MPEPDIPPIVLDEDEIKVMQADLPILPPEYRTRFATLDVDASVVGAILARQNLAQKLDQVLTTSTPDTARRVANWFASAFPVDDENLTKFPLPSTENLIKLSEMTGDNKLSSTAAKEVFAELLQHNADPEKIAQEKNLLQVSDESAIAAIVDQVLAAPDCAKAVADFRAGNEKVIGFLVGQIMIASKGQANPGLAQKLIREKLK
jgi:aspartyl-tRNA(Asn)/glutamyl-tRNA(Gln) amidotransferase subunit B